MVAAGDAVGAWFGDKLAAVLFPTAETWDQLKRLAERRPTPPELLLIVNPQWELQVGPAPGWVGWGGGQSKGSGHPLFWVACLTNTTCAPPSVSITSG